MRLILTLIAFLISVPFCLCSEGILSNDEEKTEQCSGMYDLHDWGGSNKPYISVVFDKKYSPDSAIVSVVIFEWKDVESIGVDGPDGNKIFVCDGAAVDNNICQASDMGRFILANNGNASDYRSISTVAIDTTDPYAIKYEIKKTGYYCVATFGYTAEEYNGVVVFQNSYGKLPASQIPKLPFYGGLAITYVVFLFLWMFLYFQHRSDILPVQNYITACGVILLIEMILSCGYFDYVNIHGYNAGSRVYMIVVSVYNAFRNSFAFFLLLIVCMGYGVVKPSLGKTMLPCRLLAGLHFAFGIMYCLTSFIVIPEDASPVVILFVLPLAVTMTIFYIWILISLTSTIHELNIRKQKVKVAMYKNLWRLLILSVIVIFIFLALNSYIFAEAAYVDFAANNWKSRWFILDGWLNLVFMVDFFAIAFMWRPTANNRRFAMSEELSQDDTDGFEIASLAGSLNDEDTENNNDPEAGTGGSFMFDGYAPVGSSHDNKLRDDYTDNVPDKSSNSNSSMKNSGKFSPPPYDDNDHPTNSHFNDAKSKPIQSSSNNSNTGNDTQTVFSITDEDYDRVSSEESDNVLLNKKK